MSETQNYGSEYGAGKKDTRESLRRELSETKYNWGVSLHEIDSLRAERDSLTERVGELTAERDSLTERVDDLIAQNERLTEICMRATHGE